MNLTKRIRQLLAIVLAAFTICGTGTPVHAKGETVYPEFSKEQEGSLTLFKYVNNEGGSTTTDGTAFSPNVDENLDGIQNATQNYHMIPEKGVKFSYKKIADFEQVDENASSAMYLVNMDTGFTNLLKRYGITLIPKKGGNKYAVKDTTDALTAVCRAGNSEKTGESAVRDFVKDTGTQFVDSTNNYGKTKTEHLPIGLYLVAEIDWEHQSISKHDGYWDRISDVSNGTADGGDGSPHADIVSPSSPFLVQIPVPGETKKGEPGWIYDVSAYPKNGTTNVHKDIITDDYAQGNGKIGLDIEKYETKCDYAQVNYLNDNGANGEYFPGSDDETELDGSRKVGLTHQMDAKIGDTVSQLISADVPALIGDKKHKTFIISDNMTKGLNFQRVVKVSVGPNVWNSDTNQVLQEGHDYTVQNTQTTFSVTLTDAGLQKLNALGTAAYLYVQFEGTVTQDALIGTETYPFQGEHGETIDATNQNTAKLTYATDHTEVHDYYSNTCKVYTYELDLNKVMNSQKHDSDFANVEFQIERQLPNKSYEKLPLTVKENGTYYAGDFNHSGTLGPNGGNASPNTETGVLKIIGLDSGDYRITEVKTSSGYQLLAKPLHVRLIAHKVSEGLKAKFEDGTLLHAYVWSGEKEPFDLKNYDILNTEAGKLLGHGVVSITINNNDIISILRTGGKGTILIMTVGGVILATGLFVLIKKKKESEEECDDEKND